MTESIEFLPRQPRPRRVARPLALRVFGAFAKAAPRAAERAALGLFLRPPRPRRPGWERRLRSEARETTLDTAVGPARVFRFSRGPLLPWENRAPAGRVLLVHGWGGRGTQLGAFVEPLRSRGFEVVTFDAPGHGASPAAPVDVAGFVRAIEALDAAFGPFDAAIAHSMGGGALSVALAEGARIGRAVLVGAPSRLAGVAERFTAALGLPVEGFAAALEARVGAGAYARFDVASHPERLAGRPALILHDVDDLEVPFAEARRLAELWPGARLLATAGLGHRRILKDPEAVAAALAFCAEPLDPGLLCAPTPTPASW